MREREMQTMQRHRNNWRNNELETKNHDQSWKRGKLSDEEPNLCRHMYQMWHDLRRANGDYTVFPIQ